MPRRSNLFQEVVAIIQAHLAEGAIVTESAMLRNPVTGEPREVDVVIEADAAGYPLTISVEASATRRPATVEWVERMIAKHADLPTNKLVLVSESGFTRHARALAEAKRVAVLELEDVLADDPAFRIVNALGSIWPKMVRLTPTGVRLTVVVQDSPVWMKNVTEERTIYLDDGEEVGSLKNVMGELLRSNMRMIVEQIDLANIADDFTGKFEVGVGPPWRIVVDETERQLCIREDTHGLVPIDQMEIVGDAVIRVSEVSLTHQRLGDVMYSVGEGSVGDREALILVTESERGGKMTLRFRSEKQADQ